VEPPQLKPTWINYRSRRGGVSKFLEIFLVEEKIRKVKERMKS